MRRCKKCGASIPDEYVFCPECGALADNEKDQSEQKEVVAKPEPKKKMAKKTKLIIGGIALAVLVIILVLVGIMAPRDIVINSGNNIEAYVGDDIKISVSAEGLTEADCQGIIWTSDDDTLVKVENGVLKASYDKNSFNATIDDVGGDDEKECTYTSHIYGEMKKGLRSWEGDAKVVVSLKPVEFESGKLIKEPADSRNSYIEITASDNYNTYFYLKSTSKPANDMSFLVKKGEKTTVYVPCDTYTFYEANGETWYGSKILFGPQTFYTKDSDELKFTASTYWMLELEAENGNTTSDNINSEDFPE